MNAYKKFLFISSLSSILVACGGANPVFISTPIENIDLLPLKKIELNENQLKHWLFSDLATDTIPGMSVDKAYAEIIKNRKGKTVIVGVIDSGVDIEHEDLKSVIWKNPGEIPNNGKDDDKNGYIDDIHGWNFLGDIVGENLEYIRYIRKLTPRFQGKTESTISASDKKDFEIYNKAKAEFEKEQPEISANNARYEQILSQVKPAHEAISKKLGKKDYTAKDLAEIKDPSPAEQQQINGLSQMLSFGDSIPKLIEQLQQGLDYFSARLNTHFNLNKDFRGVLNDNVDDLTDTHYGNNDVDGPTDKKEDALHGTHVSGIIAAQRGNGIGVDGVANNVKIMVLRAVPDGDEYDKDIALAIRYAVDNGAKVINTSFGKNFSPHPEWVYEAIKYAGKHDVLIVNAAGNDSEDLDSGITMYPNDQIGNESEFADNFLTVGALNFKYGSEMIAPFSNYGKSNVDVFAPGTQIWATTPLNTYSFLDGTSMASPAVAGVAAIIRSLYPKLSAKQVKYIIMASGLSSTSSVMMGGDNEKSRKFPEASKSGKMVNLYNALIMAERRSKN